MRLTVIGCSGSFPGPSAAASCYVVEHEGTTLVLDLGSGSLGPLAAATDLSALSAVLLSHLHADHCLDLTGMYVASRYHPDGRRPRLDVHGPSGTGQRIAAAYRTRPGEPVPGLDEVFRFVDHRDEPVQIGPFTVSLVRVAHPVPTFAMRLEAGGSSLVYSGDTGPTPALAQLAAECDVALFEASFRSGDRNPGDLHLTGVQAGQIATAAGVGRLILTHLVSWNDPTATLLEGRSAYDGDVALASPGMVVDL